MITKIEAQNYDFKYIFSKYFTSEDYHEIEGVWINHLHIDGDLIQYNDENFVIAKSSQKDIHTTGIIATKDIKCLSITDKHLNVFKFKF